MVTQTISNREMTSEIHKDIMQYLIQLRNNSTNLESDDWKIDSLGNVIQYQPL